MTISSLESSLLAVFLLLLMFGMGATLTRERFVAVLRAPGPLGIGLASQFGWMPLAALAIALALDLPPEVAVSLETGIQNAPLALAIVLLSFPADVAADVLVAPLLYGVIVVPISAVLALGFRRMSRPPGRRISA